MTHWQIILASPHDCVNTPYKILGYDGLWLVPKTSWNAGHSLRCPPGIQCACTRCYYTICSSNAMHMCTAGDNRSRVAIVEFSTNTYVHSPLTPANEVDASRLRTARQFSDLTYMGEAIQGCTKILSSAGNNRAAIVLLTDGVPNGKVDVVSASDAAKEAGIVMLTVGVGGANLALLAAVASGPNLTIDAAAFNNDAANMAGQVSPRLCGVGGGERFRPFSLANAVPSAWTVYCAHACLCTTAHTQHMHTCPPPRVVAGMP